MNLHRRLTSTLASSLALWGATCCSSIAQAQFGPAPVVVTAVQQREVAQKKSFVATVQPLRKSTIGSAVDGRVQHFLSHSTPVQITEQSPGEFVARLLHLPQVAVQGKTVEEVVGKAQAALAETIRRHRAAGRAIPWNRGAPGLTAESSGRVDLEARPAESAAAPADLIRWIPYDEDGTKLSEVKAGQPLAALREGTVRILLDAARAQRDLRQVEYDEVNSTHADRVAQAEARVRSASAQKDYALAKYQRYRSLHQGGRGGTISQEELELARAQATQADSAVKDAQVDYKLTEQNYDIQQAKAQLDVADAEFRRLQDRVAKYTIRAPFDGYVVAEHTEVGAWIKEGDAVAEVVQLDPIEVQAYVPEAYVAQLRVGSTPSITTAALPGRIFQGRLTSVVAAAETRSRTFPVKVLVDNPDHRLRAGMLAHVELEVAAPRQALMVPKDALVLGKDPLGTGRREVKLFVAVAGAEESAPTTARSVVVETGLSDGKWIEVVGEVSPGDLVVVAGNERLRPGAPLQVEVKEQP